MNHYYGLEQLFELSRFAAMMDAEQRNSNQPDC